MEFLVWVRKTRGTLWSVKSDSICLFALTGYYLPTSNSMKSDSNQLMHSSDNEVSLEKYLVIYGKNLIKHEF